MYCFIACIMNHSLKVWGYEFSVDVNDALLGLDLCCLERRGDGPI